MKSLHCLTITIVILTNAIAPADEKSITQWLAKPIIDTKLPLAEVQKFIEPRVPLMPPVKNVAEWERLSEAIRQNVLQNVVYRGKAADWRKQKTNVVWGETIEGGSGYKIKKLRYEAVPGMWIPALLYVPDTLKGKVPVVMNVNGHDRKDGKAAEYKQVRCINQVKRGMIALNVEWLGMGQLHTPGFGHYHMNQLDLCGTSGLAPFYLTMKRGLDILLDHPHADPKRVAVAGLSGGGWQTIFISSLDKRVTLINPVAGYSSFLTRVHHTKDLGDSEQTPCDLAKYADYTHLTALCAPRATLLTFNAKDNCCFESGYALPPLQKAAEPIFKLYNKSGFLRTHVNYDPGNHNFLKDNRQALYRMFATHFSAADHKLSAEEIDCSKEVKSKSELHVPLPEQQQDFHTLALSLSKALPKWTPGPASKQLSFKSSIKALTHTVKATSMSLKAELVTEIKAEQTQIKQWKLKLDDTWTVPAVEFSQAGNKRTTIVIADAGRKNLAPQVEALLEKDSNVLAVDLFYFGESKIISRDFLYGLLVSAVGERPLGIQSSQLAAIVKWCKSNTKTVNLVAFGPRSSLIALVAAAIEPASVSQLNLHQSFKSLKEILAKNYGVNQAPELFCFGLLEKFDIQRIRDLVVNTKVIIQ